MTKFLNPKIAFFLLSFGYSLPTHSMAGLAHTLKSLFTPAQVIEHTPYLNERREIISYNPENDVTFVLQRNPYNRKKIILVDDLYFDGQFTYGKEIGVATLFYNRLEFLKVRPEYRQQGYGTQLFEEAANYCHKQKYTLMRWKAGSFKAYENTEKMLTQPELVEFYKRRGGKTTDGDTRENDCTFYAKLPLSKQG